MSQLKARKKKPGKLNSLPPDTRLKMASEIRPGQDRKWLFRLAALAMPLVLLLLVELGLRLAGYGYPTGFFLSKEHNGQAVLVDNPRFGRRFFPPGMARTPEPFLIPAHKAPGTCRIFVFGESAAMGDPEPAYSVSRFLEVLLRARYPGKRFEVVNVGMTAINSHVIREIARDCASREGDYWIVYMGNNEVVGPFGAGTVFGPQAPGLALIRASIAVKSTRLGQWLRNLTSRQSRAGSWGGMEMFLEQQVREQDPKMATVYRYFEENLRGIVEEGTGAGARVLVSTVLSNLRDCPPFGSLHRPNLSAEQTAAWQTLFDEGKKAEADGDDRAALDLYRKAGEIDEGYAELAYREGRCDGELGNFGEARTSFEKARDLDTLRFRADSRMNKIVRNVTASEPAEQVRLVPAVSWFYENSPHGIPGEESLWEHVHLNFAGNYRLARLFAHGLAGWLPAASASAEWLSEADCARRLALTDFDRYQVVNEIVTRLEQPPFNRQLGHEARSQRYQAVLEELRDALRPEALAGERRRYQEALGPAPDDWILHAHFGRLLQDFGQDTDAAMQWSAVTNLLPWHAEAYVSLGNVLDSQGHSAEAEEVFERALALRQPYLEARNGLGLALLNQGNATAAEKQFQIAVSEKPDFSEAQVNLGQALASQGRMTEAKVEYEAALRSNTNSAAAHINLGKLLAAQGQITDAIRHYREAVRLLPRNPIAHFNLGNALAHERNPEAVAQYRKAVELNPNFMEAHNSLGLELASRGQMTQARQEFEAAVRLRPDSFEARLNLGVALAKEQRYEQAAAQFREAVKLRPGDPQARKFLSEAEARLGR